MSWTGDCVTQSKEGGARFSIRCRPGRRGPLPPSARGPMRLVPSSSASWRAGRFALWRHFTHIHECGGAALRWDAPPSAHGGAGALAERFASGPSKASNFRRTARLSLLPTWLPGPATSMLKCRAIWNCPTQAVRAGIHDGSFRHCNHAICPDIQAGTFHFAAR